MGEILESLGAFLPYCFMLCVVRIVWDMVFSAFTRGRF